MLVHGISCNDVARSTCVFSIQIAAARACPADTTTFCRCGIIVLLHIGLYCNPAMSHCSAAAAVTYANDVVVLTTWPDTWCQVLCRYVCVATSSRYICSLLFTLILCAPWSKSRISAGLIIIWSDCTETNQKDQIISLFYGRNSLLS